MADMHCSNNVRSLPACLKNFHSPVDVRNSRHSCLAGPCTRVQHAYCTLRSSSAFLKGLFEANTSRHRCSGYCDIFRMDAQVSIWQSHGGPWSYKRPYVACMSPGLLAVFAFQSQASLRGNLARQAAASMPLCFGQAEPQTYHTSETIANTGGVGGVHI